MKKIIGQLHTSFPYTKRTLLPTLEVKKDISDSEFNMKFEEAFYNNNLYRKRKNINNFYQNSLIKKTCSWYS